MLASRPRFQERGARRAVFGGARGCVLRAVQCARLELLLCLEKKFVSFLLEVEGKGSRLRGTFLDLFSFLFLALSLCWIDGSFFGHLVD
jgi:hypothetical protein